MKELERFENDLKASEELRKKLEAICVRLRDEGMIRSDGELLAAAAKELGYDFSAADMEKSAAKKEELDPTEMEAAAGGKVWPRGADCAFSFSQALTDQDNHNSFCAAAWHCYAAFLHTHVDKADKKDISCFADYRCLAVYHHEPDVY